jgi:hypothetical protein
MPKSPEGKLFHTAEVIDFNAYRNRELIDILEDALENARAGKITGAIMVLQREWRNHGVVVVGSYENDLEKICGIAGELFIHFRQLQTDRPTIID